MDALASMGLLGLIVPKEMGGLGESHVFAAVVTETIARYGCPSTAMVFGTHARAQPWCTVVRNSLPILFSTVMHTGAVACLLLRHHGNPKVRELLQRLDKDCMVGTLVYSDPATGD